MKEEKNGVKEIYLAPETNNPEVDTAVNNGASDEMSDADFPVMIEKPKANFRVGEILELRDDNRKVYRMSDGTEQAVFYPEPVHTFNKAAKIFEDVDNTLAEGEDGKYFVSGRKHFIAKLSREEETDELFSIESGIHRVTVSAKKNRKQKNKGVKPGIHKIVTEDLKTIDMLVFEGVQDNADYEYCVTGKGVKENIVVKEKSDVYRYSFILRQENVTAEFDETKKRISFNSNESGKEVFYIPAPFMTDASGVTSDSVFYEFKYTASGDAVLNVTADSDWLNAGERAFPVVIDPQIQLSGETAMTTLSYNNEHLYESSVHTVGVHRGGNDNSVKRMYMKFNIPALPRNPRIKKAELTFFQMSGVSQCGEYPKIGIYKVNGELSADAVPPCNEDDLIDFAVMKIGHLENGAVISYTFDVTSLADEFNKGESEYSNLVIKMIDGTYTANNEISLYGSAYGGDYAPQFAITYESAYGVNTSYRTHTHELGRFGQGSIDLQCGNLMFDSEDFAWAGNRMPVTIRHLYNSALSAYQYTENSGIKLNTADFSAMKIGHGFKLNIMQSVKSAAFRYEGVMTEGYVYIGENGEEAYFKESADQIWNGGNSHCYNLYEEVNDGGILYNPVKRTLQQDEKTYQFDTLGRLIQIKDAFGSHIDITYTAGRITSVTDGADREFGFAYNTDGFLTSVTAPDNTSILYTYSEDKLSTVTYPNGKKAVITYVSDKPQAVTLLDTDGNNVYKVAYTFSGDRVVGVTEYGAENGSLVIGNNSVYSYSAASGKTTVQTTEQAEGGDESAVNVIKTVYTFDDDGDVVSEYVYTEDTGNTGVKGEEGGIHPHSGDGGAGVVSNINNLLVGHGFKDLSSWTAMPGNPESIEITNYVREYYAKFGKNILRMRSASASGTETGVYQSTEVLPVGQYTFSAYIRVTSAFSGGSAPGAYIRVSTADGAVLAESEHIAKSDSEYVRLIAPFELTAAQSVQVQFLMNGKGIVCADAAQLENNPYANAYNMLENGNFELDGGWSLPSGVSYTNETCFNMSRSLMMAGNLEYNRLAYQDVTVRTARATRETFTLSGWAKAWGLPDHERDGAIAPTFRLRAVIKYYDTYYREYGTEEYTAEFSPCTEEWQFASVQFAKSKYRMVEYVRVYCEYGHNTGYAYFDDIQLIRDSIETSLSASDFAAESADGSDADSEAAETTDTTPIFDEVKDSYGNALTETTFTDGEFGTIYRAFEFNTDDGTGNAGNDLISETDARGNKTEYTVDEDTSRREEVTDRLGNKTAYEYDASGRTAKVTSKDAAGTELADVSYAYDALDNMTEIVRGDGMKYVLAYNAFHNLESIGVAGRGDKLINYTYKNGNGRLKEIAYANGDKMKAAYNSIGQMVAEKWFDKNDTLTAYYKYVYDGQGNIVRSIDMAGGKEYTYDYEEEKLVRLSEYDIILSEEIVVSKTAVNTVKYYYDSQGKLTKKRIIPEIGAEQVIYCENPENENAVVKFTAGGRTVTSHSKTDSFGRKVFDELQLGTGFVSRQFHYHAGEITEEHKDNAKLKSSATTQLVSQIVLSGGRAVSYEYDKEERITKVTDSVLGTTEYTYDALGQLLTETADGAVVNTMTYDNYGNIVTRNGIEYTYGDSNWKDLLTKVGDQTISYDAQGNPTSYLGHTLAWEKGRQLKSFDDITYTYNANGIRTSKTVNGIKHTYTLDGTKILRETWDNNTLIPMYDNEDSVCGIIFNNHPFYFHRNLQGDIIAILDKDAETVAAYSYDAWGACTIITDLSNCSIASLNPFRYRGYYFDSEIEMYYLQSRYYDPKVGRFVNADNADTFILYSILENNLCAYCFNDPINNKDEEGRLASWIVKKIVEVILGAFLGLVQQFLSDVFIVLI